MSFMYIKIFVQSIPSLISFLAEFISGEGTDGPTRKKRLGYFVSVVIIVMGYLSNIAITLTSDNQRLLKEVANYKTTVATYKSTVRMSTATIEELKDKLTEVKDDLRIARLNSCTPNGVAVTPSKEVNDKKPKKEKYIIPKDIFIILGDL